MTTKSENRAIIIASIIVGFALIGVVRFFSDMDNTNLRVLELVEQNNARLAALEAGKAAATAKRFTSDDAKVLMECTKLPYSERTPCINKIEAKFK